MQNISNTEAMALDINDVKMQRKKEGEGAPSANAVAGTKQAEEAPVSHAGIKQQLNEAILQANLEVSIRSGNDPLALLYKTAIEGINEALEPELGPNAIQKASESGLDVTPEATANRIVSMSTAFFSLYHEQHPELSEEEAAIKFADIIGGGIEKGFTEARETLDGLGVLEGDIASNIDATYDLVQDGLRAFVESFTTVQSDDDTESSSGQ